MTDYIDIPGMCGAYKVCTCDCHGPDSVMHCVPCCDKTYQKYSPELWEAIPEIQAALDVVKSKIQTPEVAWRLREYNMNRAWVDFQHEEEWNGWMIRVKMYNNPKTNSHPYEFTVWDNSNRKRSYRTNDQAYATLQSAIKQAKTFIGELAKSE